MCYQYLLREREEGGSNGGQGQGQSREGQGAPGEAEEGGGCQEKVIRIKLYDNLNWTLDRQLIHIFHEFKTQLSTSVEREFYHLQTQLVLNYIPGRQGAVICL